MAVVWGVRWGNSPRANTKWGSPCTQDAFAEANAVTMHSDTRGRAIVLVTSTVRSEENVISLYLTSVKEIPQNWRHPGHSSDGSAQCLGGKSSFPWGITLEGATTVTRGCRHHSSISLGDPILNHWCGHEHHLTSSDVAVDNSEVPKDDLFC